MGGCKDSWGSIPAVRKATLVRKTGINDGLDRRPVQRMRALILPVGDPRQLTLKAVPAPDDMHR